MDLFVIRHGETECNAAGVIQGPRIDSHLSATGKRQADQLHEAFAETPLGMIYMSPMTRARQTAHTLGDGRAVATSVVPELYELDYGAYCGRTWADVEMDVQELFQRWDGGEDQAPFPGGESPFLARLRIQAFARRLLAAGQSAVVVGHGRINRILLATLQGLPLSAMRQFPQDNANITHLAVRDGVRAVRVNDVSHLT